MEAIEVYKKLLGDEDFNPDEYLYFYNLSPKDMNVQLVSNKASNRGTYQYKISMSGPWTTTDVNSLTASNLNNTYINVPSNTYIFFKRSSNTLNDYSYRYTFITSSLNNNIKIGGDVGSLINHSPLTEYCYYMLFYNCTGIVDASDLILSSNTLVSNCYNYMFFGCTNLTSAPALPATTLADKCYYYMFANCSSLLTPPSLPAEIMYNSCYGHMFASCSSLLSAPALPATTLDTACYDWMFESCSSLKTPPALPATTLAPHCYEMMFRFTSLSTTPSLPATVLADYCYRGMFWGTNLSSVSQLPATTLAPYCYEWMFTDCTKLTGAPSLPADSINYTSYAHMFYGCTALSTPPALPAENLHFNCYQYMFYGCTSLSSTPELPATVLVSSCYSNMFAGCTSLTKIQSIKGVYARRNSCFAMFSGCTSLVNGPMLSTTIFYNEDASCYQEMFKGCSSLMSISTYQQGWTTNNNLSCTKNWVSGVDTYNGTFYHNMNTSLLTNTIHTVPIHWNTALLPTEEDVIEPTPNPDPPNDDPDIKLNIIDEGGLKVIVLPNKPDRLWGGFTVIIKGRRKRVRKNNNTIVFEDEEDGTIQTYDITEDGNGKKTITYKGVPYEIWDFEEYSDPFVISSLNGENFKVCVHNADNQGYHWVIATRSKTDGSMLAWCRKTTGDWEVWVNGSEPAYLFNLGANLMTETGAQTHISTSACTLDGYEDPVEVPVLISGQLDSLTGQMRPTKALYAKEFKGIFSGWTDLYYIDQNLILPYNTTNQTLPSECFREMFKNCTNLKGNLHFTSTLSTTLSAGPSAFYGMFEGCTSLSSIKYPPHSINPADYAYARMFYGCSNLKNFTTCNLKGAKGNNCYQSMFEGCTKLTSPYIVITFPKNVPSYAYAKMFSGCTKYMKEPEIRIENYGTLSANNYCFYSMFENTAIEDFPLEDLKMTYCGTYCCYNMFANCSNLNLGKIIERNDYYDTYSDWSNIPMFIGGATYDHNCFENMFSGCTALKYAPRFPNSMIIVGGEDNTFATFRNMFQGCTSLSAIRMENSVITLRNYYMFYGFATNVSRTGVLYTANQDDIDNSIPYTVLETNWTKVKI